MTVGDRKVSEIRKGPAQVRGVIRTPPRWKGRVTLKGPSLLQSAAPADGSHPRMPAQHCQSLWLVTRSHKIKFLLYAIKATISYSSKTLCGPNKTCWWVEFNPWASSPGSSGLVSEINHTCMKSLI